MTYMRTVALIVNPAAHGGRAAKRRPAVQREIERRAVLAHVEVTTSLEHARQAARRAAQAGQTVAVLGGDGMVGAVAGALAGQDATLAVLPCGRGNDFAAACRIPGDPVQACRLLATGDPVSIDLGEVYGTCFVGVASVGIDSEAARIANGAWSRLGALAYPLAIFQAVARWRHPQFNIDMPSGARSFQGWTVAVANSGRYGGGILMAPDASMQDGMLDVVCAGATSRARFVRDIPNLFRGRHVDSPSVTVDRSEAVFIGADRELDIYADGEFVGHTPATIRVIPAALKVLMPAAPTPATGRAAAPRAAGQAAS
jgi:YegS/Rv2252/BmrU family lipid kinase